jgi:hypothetical protein
MPSPELWAGALSLLLRHNLTGCTHSARQAATVLERIASCPEVDAETRALCENASFRLSADQEARQCRNPN